MNRYKTDELVAVENGSKHLSTNAIDINDLGKNRRRCRYILLNKQPLLTFNILQGAGIVARSSNHRLTFQGLHARDDGFRNNRKLARRVVPKPDGRPPR